MKLADYRKMQGKTQMQACKELGVSLNAYFMWENGLRHPTQNNLKKIYKWSSGKVTPFDFTDWVDFK